VIGPTTEFGESFPFMIVVPMTTTRRGLSLHVEVEASADNGLDSTTYAQCELLRSLNRRRLVTRLGAVEADVASRVEQIIRALLGY